jgi:dephospho-CoA kinase
MEPGQPVFDEIVRVFGPEVLMKEVSGQGQPRLDRARLADLVFRGSRLQELNAIVHPAAIAAQAVWMREVFARNPAAIAIVESALIFEVERDAQLRGESEGVLADWRNRFDFVVVVTATEETKIARYVARILKLRAAAAGQPDSQPVWDESIAADARSRLARQMSDEEKVARADFVIENTGDLAALRSSVRAVWAKLQAANKSDSKSTSNSPGTTIPPSPSY